MIDIKSDLKEAKLNKNKKIVPRPAPRKDRMGIVYSHSPIDEFDSIPIPPIDPTDIVHVVTKLTKQDNIILYTCVGLFAVAALSFVILLILVE